MTISFQDLLKIKNFIKNSKDQSGKKKYIFNFYWYCGLF